METQALWPALRAKPHPSHNVSLNGICLRVVSRIWHGASHVIRNARLRQAIAEGALGTRFRSTVRSATVVVGVRIGNIGLRRRHRWDLHALRWLLRSGRCLLILKSRDAVMCFHAIDVFNHDGQKHNCDHEDNKHCADSHCFWVCHGFSSTTLGFLCCEPSRLKASSEGEKTQVGWQEDRSDNSH